MQRNVPSIVHLGHIDILNCQRCIARIITPKLYISCVHKIILMNIHNIISHPHHINTNVIYFNCAYSLRYLTTIFMTLHPKW